MTSKQWGILAIVVEILAVFCFVLAVRGCG